MKRKLTVCLAACVLGALASTGDAAAGPYKINSCASDSDGYSTRAFSAFATRGMKWRRACRRGVSGQRGLVASNVRRRGRVKRGSIARFVLSAAPNTEFTEYDWQGAIRRVDCRYTVEIYAVRPAASGQPRVVKPIVGKSARRGCPRRGRAQAARRIGSTYDVAGTTRIVQRIICAGRRTCSARSANYIKTYRSSLEAVNVSPPQVTITGGELVSGRWLNGKPGVSYNAVDDVGVQEVRLLAGGARLNGERFPCDDSLAVPCPSGPSVLELNATSAAEGSQQVIIQAQDAAGNVGNSAPAIARIDKTPPTAVPVTIEGGEAWRNSNSFGATWANPPEIDRAPIAAARYRLCRAGGPCGEPGIQSGAGIARLSSLQVPAGGDWVLRMWREDAAGNQREADASPPVSLRYDPDAPQLAFEPVGAADPTLVAVSATDPLSGVAGGQIEISQEGSGSWRGLTTQLAGDRLTARIDDAALPPGRYLLRARAGDHAGNSALSDRLADGSTATVTLPLRAGARLRAGFARSRSVRRVVRRRGKRRVMRRRVTRLKPALRVRRGRTATVAGVLRGPGGGALAGATVHVLEVPEGGPERSLGSVATDRAGRYRYRVRASTNATLRLVYPGTPLIRGAQGTLRLSVPAGSSLRTGRRRLANGQAAVFRGRVVPRPALTAGKLVELQTLLSGRWQTFRTVRANARGRWRVSYRFRRTAGVVRYRFRARLPREAGYPFTTGRTRAVSVTVVGR